jgi:hypothetical protein
MLGVAGTARPRAARRAVSFVVGQGAFEFIIIQLSMRRYSTQGIVGGRINYFNSKVTIRQDTKISFELI